MRGRLSLCGYLNAEEPNVVVISGCTVTALAERKARQAAVRSRRDHPGAKIVLVGCLADAVRRGLTSFRSADLVAGNAWKPHIDEVVRRAAAGVRGVLSARPEDEPDGGPQGSRAAPAAGAEPGRVRAYLKIQDGCQHACTYCRTTQVRGLSRSRSPEDAVNEAQELATCGIPELVLVGIDLADYRPAGGTLAGLLARLDGIRGVRRLRLGSMNPEGLTDGVLGAMAGLRATCPHFHLPLQSGDDRILARMGRPYDVASYLDTVQRVRDAVPHATFGTDLIVGFPGESAAAFRRTCGVLSVVGFVNVHIFRYSPRRGTRAAALADDISPTVKRQRAQELDALASAVRGKILREAVGTAQSVLVERSEGKLAYGYTAGYVKAVVRTSRPMGVGEDIRGRVVSVTTEGVEARALDE